MSPTGPLLLLLPQFREAGVDRGRRLGHCFVADGMQQALEYAEILDLPFAYSSNGETHLLAV